MQWMYAMYGCNGCMRCLCIDAMDVNATIRGCASVADSCASVSRRRAPLLCDEIMFATMLLQANDSQGLTVGGRMVKGVARQVLALLVTLVRYASPPLNHLLSSVTKWSDPWRVSHEQARLPRRLLLRA